MKLSRSPLAFAELLLISPAVLFMLSLFVRNLQPAQYEPAHIAQQIVDWYAVRPGLALGAFLIAFPLLVLLTGAWTLINRWRAQEEMRRSVQQWAALASAHLDSLLLAVATAAAGGILAIVALHMLTE